MTIGEFFGLLLGEVLGLMTFCVSFVRGARMFHPEGLLFEAAVISQKLGPHALVRLSSAWWKYKEWRDVLGIAIRFSHAPMTSTEAQPQQQDLLFATISSPWLVPAGPFLTEYHDYLSNFYYAVSPFEREKQRVKLRLVPKHQTHTSGSRSEKLHEAVLEGEAVFLLQETHIDKTSWNTFAEIKLIRVVHFDQEALRFNPFLNGSGIVPRGFVHFLRKGAYRMSQLARPARNA